MLIYPYRLHMRMSYAKMELPWNEPDNPSFLLNVAFTNATEVARVGFILPFVCFFLQDISKTDAAMITKLDTEMFHDES